MVLLILAVIWAAVLIPPRLRARAEGRPADSIGAFRRHLGVLQRTGPYAPMPGAINAAHGTIPIRRPAPVASPLWSPAGTADARRRQTQARRREVFMGLVISMAATLVLGLLPALRVFWALHLVLDVLFLGYCALLIQMKSVAAERSAKVRYLRPRPVVAEPALLRRSVN